jgi:hypothetical protein
MALHAELAAAREHERAERRRQADEPMTTAASSSA